MKQASLSFIVAAALFGAIPAQAGGISFDLPRLDFSAPQPDASRACASLATVAPNGALTKS